MKMKQYGSIKLALREFIKIEIKCVTVKQEGPFTMVNKLLWQYGYTESQLDFI